MKQFLNTIFNQLKSKEKYLDYLLVFLLFLLGFNPFSLNKFFVIPFFILVFIRTWINSAKKPPISFWIVFAFAVSFTLFYGLSISFDITAIKHLCVPITFYLIGRHSDSNKAMLFIVSYAVGLFIGVLLNLSRTIAETGFALSTNQRIYISFATGNSISATLFSLFADLAFAISIVVLFSKPTNFKKWYLVSFSICCLILCAYGLIILKNRSFLLIAVIILLLFLFAKSTNKIYPSILTVSVFIFYATVKLNFFNLAYKLYEIPFLSRFIIGGSNSNRLKIYELFFGSFYKYPFGGMPNTTDFPHEFVHNVFLDVYSLAGVLPFIMFLLASVLLVLYTFRKLRAFPCSRDYLLIFSCYAILLLFLFEPVVQADYYYFSLIFLYFGYFSHFDNKYIKNRKIENVYSEVEI